MKILTIDLEDWFHILDNELTNSPAYWDKYEARVEAVTLKLLELLDIHNTKATFFILGWLASKYPSLVNEIKLRGHQIACHSNYHQLIYNQSPEEFEKDLVTATEAIFNASNITPTIYRAPGFSITESTPWAFDILAKNGYKVDCSVFPMRRSHGGLTNFPKKGPCIIRTTDGSKLTCLPINTRRILGQELVYSGGGYFRLTPLSLLDYFFSTDDYVMTYFHPRDFDPYQPMAPGLNFIRRFKSYVGLSSTYKKLSTLLSKFDFLTVDEALNELVKIEVELPEINFYDSEFNFANNF